MILYAYLLMATGCNVNAPIIEPSCRADTKIMVVHRCHFVADSSLH